MSLLAGEALDGAELTAPGERLGSAAALAALVGAFSIALGVLRAGFVVDFMSHSVMAAFCTASGIIIATSQAKHVLGLSIPRHHYWWQTAGDLLTHLPDTDGATAAMGLTLLAGLMFLKAWKGAGDKEARDRHILWRWLPSRPRSIPYRTLKLVADLSSIACVVIGWLWGFAYRQLGVDSVAVIGNIDDAGLGFTLPTTSHATASALAVPALLMAVVGFLETVAVGGKLAREQRYSFDANQELLALGAANCAGAVMAGFPITGGFSRTAVNAMFGATSQVAGALTGVLVAIAIYVALPAVETLPLAALAPLIIHGAIGITDFGAFAAAMRANRPEAAIMLATLGVSLGLTVKEGLLAGVALSILLLVARVAAPNMALCGRTLDGNYRDVRYYPEAVMPKGAVVLRLDARLCFANAQRFQDFCLRAASVPLADEGANGGLAHFVVVDCKSVSGADMTGCRTLGVLASTLKRRGQALLIANLKAPLAAALCQAGVHETLASHDGSLCWSLDQALAIAAGEAELDSATGAVLDLCQRVSAAQPTGCFRRRQPH